MCGSSSCLDSEKKIDAALKKTRPFLKWAGGKYQLINKIQPLLPQGKRLVEPFVGAGAVFLNTAYTDYVLADINADLMNCFAHLKLEQQAFINYAKSFFCQENNNKDAFSSFKAVFNTTDDKRLKAALFIYLNRHCFNGLMRYNQSGLYNTSFGHYTKAYFPEQEMQFFMHKLQRVALHCEDYFTVMNNALPGDVIYCDPPYWPLSKTAHFTQYHLKRFDQTDQERLASQAQALAARGITVVISNHDLPAVRGLYVEAECFGFEVWRGISCQGDNRVKVSELLAVFKPR